MKNNEAQRIHTRKVKPSAPPSSPDEKSLAVDGEAPRLWHFTWSHPEIPATVSVVVNAPSQREARGAAYLISEDFAANINGVIKEEGV
jgi:hypothetical protein